MCIDDACADAHKPAEKSANSDNRLGPAGLALHYANMIIQIDTLVGVLSLLMMFI